MWITDSNLFGRSSGKSAGPRRGQRFIDGSKGCNVYRDEPASEGLAQLRDRQIAVGRFELMWLPVRTEASPTEFETLVAPYYTDGSREL
jgi:hypothetical protein